MEIKVLHEVRDEMKFLDIRNNMKEKGWIGRPILVVDCGDYYQALTGSHRIAAALDICVDIPKMIIDIQELCEDNDMTIDDITRNLDYFHTLLKDYNAEAASLLLEDL